MTAGVWFGTNVCGGIFIDLDEVLLDLLAISGVIPGHHRMGTARFA